MRSIRSIDGRDGKDDVPGVARGPENSAPVPVRLTTLCSRAAPMSWKASGNSPCGRNPQRSDCPSVCKVTCRMPLRRSIRAVWYLLAYSSSELIGPPPLFRYPIRLGERAVGRVDGQRHALLPLREDQRDIDAAALLVKADRPRERGCGGSIFQIHLADRLGDFDALGRAGALARGGALDRLLEGPH